MPGTKLPSIPKGYKGKHQVLSRYIQQWEFWIQDDSNSTTSKTKVFSQTRTPNVANGSEAWTLMGNVIECSNQNDIGR